LYLLSKTTLYCNQQCRTIFNFFIVAPCILKSTQFTHQQMHYLLTSLKLLNLH